MRLVHCKERNRFEAVGSYAERFTPKNVGFRWDAGVGRWWTPDVEIANALVEHADDETACLIRQKLTENSAVEEAALAASRAVDADIDIPAPPGRNYFGYQRAGIAFALERPDTLFGDEMGLGKTIQAIGVVNVGLATVDHLHVLVVAPKIALTNWERELREWHLKPLTIARWTSADQAEADIVIVNYEILSKAHIVEKLRRRTWDIAIFDEAHALKNPKSQRTKAVFGDRTGSISPIPAARRLFLTGTPILNRPIELFPILNAIGLSIAESYFSFAKRFCNGHQTAFGFDATGASNLEDLQHILRTTCMVRRLKSDVLNELPEKQYQLVVFDPIDTETRAAVQAEREAYDDWHRKIAELNRRVDAAKVSGDKKAFQEAVGQLRAGERAKWAELCRLRHETALAKVPQVVEHVAGVLETTSDAVLLFAHHLDVIEKLEAGLKKMNHSAAVITGNTNDAERECAQSDIRERRKRIFIGSMRACGVAINLPEASTVIFAEQDWTPGVMVQCEDRAHRIGQRNSVLVQYLVLSGSIDASENTRSIDPQIAQTVARKEEVIEAALDRTVEEGEGHFVSPRTKSDAVLDHRHRGTELEQEQSGPNSVPAGRNIKSAVEQSVNQYHSIDVTEPETATATITKAMNLEAAGSELPTTSSVPGGQKIEALPNAPSASSVPVSKRGRPPIGERPMTQAERNRRWRDRKRMVAIEVPEDVAKLLQEIRGQIGGSNAEILSKALQGLTGSRPQEGDVGDGLT